MSDILLDVKDLVIHYETDDGLVQAIVVQLSRQKSKLFIMN
jgi:hypothetical protein